MSAAPTHDALGRRRRERRVALGKIKKPTARNLVWLETLHRHGPLPSSYLHAHTAHLCRNAAWARRELADLFHEASVHGGPYLDRPWQQFDTIDARHNDLVYDVTEAGMAALADARGAAVRRPVPAGPWVHRHMVACITASIELAARASADMRFIPQDAITAGPLRVAVPFTYNGTAVTHDLIPDAVFGLEYRTAAGPRYRVFALEADRGTEPGRHRSLDRKSWLRTLLQYREYAGAGLYKRHLGVNAGMLVLTVTTSAARAQSLVDLVADLSAGGANSFLLFQHVPAFGRFFKPPPPLPALLHGPWQRAGHDAFRIDRA